MKPFTEDTVQEMVSASQRDIARFEALYRHFYPLIAGFLFKRCGNSSDASDLAQQVFIKAMLNIQGYRFKGVPFAAWLFRIAINELNLFHRQRGRLAVIEIEPEHLREFSEEVDVQDHELLLEKLEQLLATLNTDDRLLIEMRFFEKRDFKEIALLMNMNEPAVKMKCYRLLEKLKSRLQ